MTSFDEDLEFLQRHVDTRVLHGEGEDRAVVVPAWQCRLVTSSARGGRGQSHGWINRAHVASGARHPRMNAFGGEDRFWLGPEGGQFGLFFEPGSPFEYDHWKTPASIDWEPWPVTAIGSARVQSRVELRVTNHRGTPFEVGVDREISLLSRDEIAGDLPLDTAVDVVAHESDNRITNRGTRTWNRADGLLSIWILGMFRPGPRTTVVLPVRGDPSVAVNTGYFGPIGAERLRRIPGAVLFRGDGRVRGKIGIRAHDTRPSIGAWDPDAGVLTIVQFTLPENAHDYVNSMWEHQADPFAGDAVNSYNDGPAPDGSVMGPFYELETSSAAALLGPGESLSHRHRTLHFEGAADSLNAIALEILGVGLDAVDRW